MLTKIKIRDASVVELNGRSRRMMMLGTLVYACTNLGNRSQDNVLYRL